MNAQFSSCPGDFFQGGKGVIEGVPTCYLYRQTKIGYDYTVLAHQIKGFVGIYSLRLQGTGIVAYSTKTMLFGKGQGLFKAIGFNDLYMTASYFM